MTFETSIIFTAADGRKFLRGMAGDPTDTELVNKAVELGAVSWRTLGTVEVQPGLKLVDVDYDPFGEKVKRVVRTF